MVKEIKIFDADILCQNIINSLKDSTGIVAYALSKNLRIITNELEEYSIKKNELFHKYGTEIDGKWVIPKDSENYQHYMEEMSIFQDETISVDLRIITEQEAIESGLNGEQLFLLYPIIE